MPGRELPPASRFAADDGAADPILATALARRATGNGSLADVVSALAHVRVLVPVLAVEHDEGPDDESDDGPDGGSDGACAVPDRQFAEARHASAGVVAVAAPDGRTALPVFSSVATLSAWHPTARPMPAEGTRAAAAALGEGWDLLVVDPGGDVTVVVPRPAVRALAEGRSWIPAVTGGQVAGAVCDAVRAAVHDATAALLAVDVVPGRRAEVAVVLTLEAGLSQRGLEAVLADVAQRLAADAAVTAAVDTLELRPVRDTGGPIDDAAAEVSGADGTDAASGSGRGRRWRRAPGRR